MQVGPEIVIGLIDGPVALGHPDLQQVYPELTGHRIAITI
jgi:hypothetical protein